MVKNKVMRDLQRNATDNQHKKVYPAGKFQTETNKELHAKLSSFKHHCRKKIPFINQYPLFLPDAKK